MAEALLPRYARAQTISFTDERIHAQYVTYASPGGTSGQMRGYLVTPVGKGPFPTVIVVHENRGLNPYVEDVARRLGVAGFLALAPDGLAPVGGYPGNDDDGRDLQAKLDPGKLRTDMLNSAKWVRQLPASNGRLGAVGFCWGGGTVNWLAVQLGPDLAAAAPFYGAAPAAGTVAAIKAPVLAHFAEKDPAIDALWPAYDQALTAAGVPHEAFVYPGTQHGFHNDSTPRYDAAAAKLAWERTIAFFRAKLG